MADASGSRWRKWDLHFHTPKSYDHGDKGKTAKDLVQRLSDAEIAVVAITDHHVLDAAFIDEMQKASVDDLTVLPGIELTSNLGGSDGVHFIAIFSENANLKHLSTELIAKLGLGTKRQNKTTEEKLYVDFNAAVPIIRNWVASFPSTGTAKHLITKV